MKQFRTLILLLVYFSFGSYTAYANIKVGTEWYYPPFQVSTGTGFDPGLLEMICQGLKEQCDIVHMGYYKLFIAVDKGTVDIAMSGITLPVLGPGNYIHSTSYASSNGSFMVLKSSGIKSIGSLQGKVVGILRETPTGDGIYFNYLNTTYAGKFTVKKYDQLEDLVYALNSKEVSASFTNDLTTTYWDIHGNNRFKKIGKPVVLGEGIGIIAQPNNAALMVKINQQIEILKKNTAFKALYATYFSTAP